MFQVKLFTNGLYYKHIMFVNDNPRVVSEWHYSLELSVMILEHHLFSFVMFIVHNLWCLSIDDRNKVIVQAAGESFPIKMDTW